MGAIVEGTESAPSTKRTHIVTQGLVSDRIGHAWLGAQRIGGRCAVTRLLEGLAKVAIQRRRVVLAVAGALTVVAAFGVARLKLNADFSTYLDARDPLVRTYNYVGDEFAGNATGLVLVTAPDVFTPEVLRTVDTLTNAYRNVEGVTAVTSLSNALDFRKTDWGLEVGRLLAQGLPQDSAAAAAFRDHVLANDRYVGNLVSEDGTATAIVVRFQGGRGGGSEHFATASRLHAVTNRVVPRADRPDGVEILYGGLPFLMFNMTLLISHNMVVLVPLMVGVLLLVFAIGLRGWGGVVYPMTVVLVSTVWVMGMMGFLGLRVDLLSGIVPVILIALGSADGIHYMKRYYEHRRAGDGPREAARRTYVDMGGALVLTTVTTMAGFASLAISDFVVIRQFGLVAAVGLVFALVATLTLIPALASYGGGRGGATRSGAARGGWRVADRLGDWLHRRKTAALVGVGAAVVLAAVGIPRIVKSVDWTLCLKRGSAPFHAEMLLREKFGGSLPLSVLVEGDLKDPAVLTAVRRLERRLDATPGVGKSQSMADVIAEMNNAMNGRYAVPATVEGVANLWFLVEGEELLDHLVRKDGTEGVVQAKVADWDTRSVVHAVDSAQAFLATVPAEFEVVDLRTVPADRLGTLLVAHRADLERQMRWEFAGRHAELDSWASNLVADEFLRWTPADHDYAAVGASVQAYLGSPEAEVPVGERKARLMAASVETAWRGAAASPSMGVLVNLVRAALPDADDWEIEQLAISLDVVGTDAMAEGRVSAVVAELDRLAPALRRDSILQRNVRGLFWEASGPLWAAEPATVRAAGLTGGAAVVRSVPVTFRRAGMASVLKQMEERLTPTQLRSLLATLIAVLLLLAVLFRSVSGGVLMLVPLAGTILVNFGVMGYVGIGLDAFTTMVASIAVGLGVDYAIHFTHRYRTELASAAGDVRVALRSTLATSGAAILVNSASIGLGFLVLLGAGGQHLRRFGGLTALTMLVSGALTLVVLPALYVWLRPRFLRQEVAAAESRATSKPRLAPVTGP